VPSEEDCQRALDLHAMGLLSLPGVEGVGIGVEEEGVACSPCCIVVYLAGAWAEAKIPQGVELTSGGAAKWIKVRAEVQGTLEPQVR
jgi:hypothetical protein